MIPFRSLILPLLGAATTALAQWDVGNLAAYTVKANVPWGSVALRLDTLDLDISISHGLVRTKATLAWTPDSLPKIISQLVPNCSVKDSALGAPNCLYVPVYDTTPGGVADSLELRGYFNIPQDAAVTGLWLWVGDQKVPAVVMDRWLASQQYAQIVGKRRDPALLETWGNGSYNFNLFPLKSGERRKVQVEIVQALSNGLKLPFQSTPRLAYDAIKQSYLPESTQGRFVRVAVRSDDASGTTLDLGRLGTLVAGPTDQVKSWNSTDSLIVTVTGSQPPVWTAVDGAGKGAFGANLTFQPSDIKFQAEPGIRLVVLDADDSLDRSRKLALMSLAKYGVAPYRVNLVWNDGTGLKHLWPNPVSLDAARGQEAIAFLRSWKPALKADAKAILASVAKADTGAVVVLISTAMSEEFTVPYPTITDYSDSSQFKVYQVWADTNTRFWNRLNAQWDSIGEVLADSRLSLFGWWSDYAAYRAASRTGGHSFGSVVYPWSYWYFRGEQIVAPNLYGPSRNGYRENPENLEISIDGVAVDSLAYLMARSWGPIYWLAGGIATSGSVKTVAARAAHPADVVNSYPDSLSLLLAARYFHGGSAKVHVRGTWGGLKFEGVRNLSIPEPVGQDWGVRTWAGEYVNMIQPYIWSDTGKEAAARKLGKGYAIVTPATSFLALEPGVKPLDSMAGQLASTSDLKSSAVAGALAANVSSANFDASSLEDILAGRVASVKGSRSTTPATGLRIRTGASIQIEVWGHPDNPGSLKIVDLKGREVARLVLVQAGDHMTATWKPSGRGVFTALAQGQGWSHSVNFAVGN